MKADELLSTLTAAPAEEAHEEEEVEGIYSDEDFWEALDLLESSRKQIKAVLRVAGLNASRTKLLTNLADDIGQFLNYFIEEVSK